MTMNITWQIVVFDAPDLAVESGFWAGVLGGDVDDSDDEWHSVRDTSGAVRIGVQLAPDHVPPDWPDGHPQQQLHIDLYVSDIGAAHDHVTALGAKVVQEADLAAGEGFQVYVDPAGHPFCLCWR